MFSRPNYTQTPNEFFDDIAKTLKEGELRVLLVIMRQTFGWGNKSWDRISISQLIEKTGMKRWAVVKSTKSLVEKKMVTKHKEGKKGEEQSWYSLVVETPSEFTPPTPSNLRNPIDNQNNSYQSPKETPPSLLKRPTKETLTKERKESSLAVAKEKSAEPPPPLFEPFVERFEGKIKITQKNYERLLEKFKDPELIESYAEKVYRWSFNNEKKFSDKKRHDMVIEDWIEKDKEKAKASPSPKGSDSDLNDNQKEQWRLNQEVVQDLKLHVHSARGLHFFYKNHLLKDKNDPSFDISGLVNHKDFCRYLGKHLNVDILRVRFPNG